ncbi:MAG: permease [Bacteroidota bacterium]|nr:permease [Bacteroidota bacterium]
MKGTDNKKMNQNMKEKQKKGMIRDLIILGAVLIITVILISIFPDRKGLVINTSWDFFIEMILIFPAVLVLLGLFAVFVPNEIVKKYIGKTSGIKGIILALIFGALPTGPLYVAFSMAAALLNKGAKISNIIVFLSAWACIKIPQEMVELQFLGSQFMLLRLTLTIIFVIIMGITIEKIMKWSDKKIS